MKRFLLIFLTLLITLSATAYAVSAPKLPEPFVKVYSLDGRIAFLNKTRAQEYIENGWVTDPVVKIYKPNGETSVVYKRDVDVRLNNGWYIRRRPQ